MPEAAVATGAVDFVLRSMKSRRSSAAWLERGGE